MDLPAVDGNVRKVRVHFTVCSSRQADGEALIERCHVVSSRARLTESGRLTPGVAQPREIGPDRRWSSQP
ncbi:MAG: hypothetical protein ACLQPH_11790 [Acidimicrobiales bacterium]